ncbi:MAG: nuclear transport factor 2 family protein [Steroidobacteraceae bacterium]
MQPVLRGAAAGRFQVVGPDSRGQLPGYQRSWRAVRQVAVPTNHRSAGAADLERGDRRIQTYGNTAVVTVKFAVKGIDQGKPHIFAGRATDVWIRRTGNWYCVAAHSSAIT